jgi:hypothetical protein
MNFHSCSHQQEVAAALRERRWPEASTSELRKHVEACAGCKDLVLVTQTLQQARQETMRMARPIPAGLLWWRAQLRRREIAVERAAKPITLVETLALAGTLLMAAVLAIGQRAELADWLRGLRDLSYSGALPLDALWPASSGGTLWTLLVGSAAFFGVLGGVAAYLIVRSE